MTAAENPVRWRVAYLKLAYGLTVKEAAGRLGISYKLADHYWNTAMRLIRGKRERE